jgi:hypothetical protein
LEILNEIDLDLINGQKWISKNNIS